jgi:hypothetical protein
MMAVACFFQPLGQCSFPAYQPPAKVVPGEALQLVEAPERSTAELIPSNVVSRETKDWGDLLATAIIVLAFFWPLATALMSRRVRSPKIAFALSLIELGGSPGSLYLLFKFFILFGRILPASYLRLPHLVAICWWRSGRLLDKVGGC